MSVEVLIVQPLEAFWFLLTGWPMVFLSMVSFLLFTDMSIYWIHRFLHHKLIYKVTCKSISLQHS